MSQSAQRSPYVGPFDLAAFDRSTRFDSNPALTSAIERGEVQPRPLSPEQQLGALMVEATRLNEAHDVVTSDGATVKPLYSEERIARNLRGDNAIGPFSFGFYGQSQQLGSMASGSNRRYDIKDGVAMRGVSPGTPDHRGNVSLSSAGHDEAYKPFAPQHQEAAKRAIRSLGEKQLIRANEIERRRQVKRAKATLGRGGVEIPKSKLT